MKKIKRKKTNSIMFWNPTPFENKEEFIMAFHTGIAACEFKTPPNLPSKKPGFIFTDEDGTQDKFTWTDHPMNIFLFSVRDFFCSEGEKFIKFITRFFALQELLKTNKMKQHTIEVQGGIRINNFTLFHVATCPMKKVQDEIGGHYEFDEDQFFSTLNCLEGNLDMGLSQGASKHETERSI